MSDIRTTYHWFQPFFKFNISFAAYMLKQHLEMEVLFHSIKTDISDF